MTTDMLVPDVGSNVCVWCGSKNGIFGECNRHYTLRTKIEFELELARKMLESVYSEKLDGHETVVIKPINRPTKIQRHTILRCREACLWDFSYAMKNELPHVASIAWDTAIRCDFLLGNMP